MVGVDCEWASFKGAAGVVSLLQMATTKRAYLFDIKKLKEVGLDQQWYDSLVFLYRLSHISLLLFIAIFMSLFTTSTLRSGPYSARFSALPRS